MHSDSDYILAAVQKEHRGTVDSLEELIRRRESDIEEILHLLRGLEEGLISCECSCLQPYQEAISKIILEKTNAW
jgi:hypothetical protein